MFNANAFNKSCAHWKMFVEFDNDYFNDDKFDDDDFNGNDLIWFSPTCPNTFYSILTHFLQLEYRILGRYTFSIREIDWYMPE